MSYKSSGNKKINDLQNIQNDTIFINKIIDKECIKCDPCVCLYEEFKVSNLLLQ